MTIADSRSMLYRAAFLVLAYLFVICYYFFRSNQASPVYPVVHITYDTPIEGYTISANWYPTGDTFKVFGDSVYITWGPADFVLHNNQTKKDIMISSDGISVPEWIFTVRKLSAEESLVLHHTPFGNGDDVIPVGNDQIVFFADIDFDGEKEFVVNSYKGGAQWANTYVAYELTEDNAEMITYPPFFGKEERFEDNRIVFHSENKTVESYHGIGIGISSIVYQFDGSGGIPTPLETSVK